MADTAWTQRDFWKWLYEEGAESTKRQRMLDEVRRSLIPAIEGYSLRHLVQACEEASVSERDENREFLSCTTEMHPDAFGIIAAYGAEYQPKIFSEPPSWGEPEQQQCFLNAWRRTVRSARDQQPLAYVEGIAVGINGYLFAHAWNATTLGDVEAIDWTLYASCRGLRYIGVALTFDEHAAVARITGRTSIFQGPYFNQQAKDFLLSVLKSR